MFNNKARIFTPGEINGEKKGSFKKTILTNPHWKPLDVFVWQGIKITPYFHKKDGLILWESRSEKELERIFFLHINPVINNDLSAILLCETIKRHLEKMSKIEDLKDLPFDEIISICSSDMKNEAGKKDIVVVYPDVIIPEY